VTPDDAGRTPAHESLGRAARGSRKPTRRRAPAAEGSLTDQARRPRRLLILGALTGGAAGLRRLLASGAVTLDLDVGRTLRPLGPIVASIAAPRELVFEVISSPYLQRTPRALEQKLKVLERGSDMVLAAHFTQTRGFVTTTVETVRFEPPSQVHFRLVRGPAPHVVEQFVLRETADGTELEYVGELGTDLWALGRWWGTLVARRWEAAVESSLEAVKVEAERRAARER
jgi:hypothetical protein